MSKEVGLYMLLIKGYRNEGCEEKSEGCGLHQLRKWEKKYAMLHKEIMGDNGSVFCEMKGFFKGEKCT